MKRKPVKYNPSFCEEAIVFFSDGRSMAEYAAYKGVLRETVYYWAETNPEFAESIKLAREAEEAWWSRSAREGIYQEGVNAALMKFNLSARLGWSEKSEQKVDAKISHEDALKVLE